MSTSPNAIVSPNAPSLLLSIAAAPTKNAKNVNKNLKERVSRRILLAQHNQSIHIVCPKTGIVSLLNIPTIPHSVLEWTSPLASLANCRGIVQQGADYLSLLDSQVLAGLLITIADSYALLKYQPADTGAQKNAILRTAGKDTLINALLLVEDFINSTNFLSLPCLSLIFDAAIEQGGISARMTEWLRLIAGAIMTRKFRITEETEQDTFYREIPKKQITPEYVKKPSPKAVVKEAKAFNSVLTEQKELKADIKIAKSALKTLLASSTLSTKLSGMLKSIFSEEALIAMDSSMRSLVATKLADMNLEAATILSVILLKPYASLRDDFAPLDAPLVAGEATGTIAVGASISIAPISIGTSIAPTASSTTTALQLPTIASAPQLTTIETPTTEVSIDSSTTPSTDTTISTASQLPAIASAETIETVPAVAVGALTPKNTFKEILEAKRLLAQQAASSTSSTSSK